MQTFDRGTLSPTWTLKNMKYGVLYNKTNVNIGDDIQAYASSQFLPSIDYFVDRENMNSFVSHKKEPVAVIMSAWYMWKKWNWPPSKYIYPHFVGFHYADHQKARQPGSTAKYEFLEGLGGEYMKAYGPIGCRDHFTRKNLEKLGIESYYSGCITLTLPKQPETEDKGTYICLVDVDKRVENKIKKDLDNEDIEIRVSSHTRKRDDNLSWDDRMEIVKQRLTTYQNARCVVTKRLHVALPCLAMGVPVFMVKGMSDDIRFDPYFEFLHSSTIKDFIEGKTKYDFMNPPANKDLYKPVREQMIKSCEDFVEKTKNINKSANALRKIKFSKIQLHKWRYQTMEKVLNNSGTATKETQDIYMGIIKEERAKIRDLKKENKELKKRIKELTK